MFNTHFAKGVKDSDDDDSNSDDDRDYGASSKLGVRSFVIFSFDPSFPKPLSNLQLLTTIFILLLFILPNFFKCRWSCYVNAEIWPLAQNGSMQLPRL